MKKDMHENTSKAFEDQNILKQLDPSFRDDYLQMPDIYSQFVDQCVREALSMSEEAEEAQEDTEKEAVLAMAHQKSGSLKKKTGWTLNRVAAAVIIAAICGGGTVYAANHYHLLDILSGRGYEVAQEDIHEVSSEEQEAEQELPQVLSWVDTEGLQDFDETLFGVTECYYDGSKLYIYGEATEEGRAYTYFTDRLIIDGQQYACEFTELGSSRHYYQGEDQPSENDADELWDLYNEWNESDHEDIYKYYACVELEGEELPETVSVQMPLNVYPVVDGILNSWQDEDGSHLVEVRSDGELADDSWLKESILEDGGQIDDTKNYTLRYNLLDESEDGPYKMIGVQTIRFDVSCTVK